MGKRKVSITTSYKLEALLFTVSSCHGGREGDRVKV
jgi:hypothetical protein